MSSITDSITHVVCAPRIYGLRGNTTSSVQLFNNTTPHDKMIDGGLNVCITGNLGAVLDDLNIDPVAILVALEGAPSLFDNCITKQGLLPLLLLDGTIYYQTCFYCENLVETIISPAAVLTSSDVFVSWQQEGFKDPSVLGRLRFTSHDGLVLMSFTLYCHNGLHYCNSNVYTMDPNPIRAQCSRTAVSKPTQANHPTPSCPAKFAPTTRAWQIEAEVWALQLGSPNKHQLNVLPQHVMGTPSQFHYHPFWFIDFKEQAYIRTQPANCSADRLPDCGSIFFVDFGFMCASADDYKQPNKATDCIVLSYNGFSVYLAFVDGASRHVTALKEPLLHILCTFMSKFGCGNGMIRLNQGSELAQSGAFCTMMLDEFSYVVEPTSADSTSQNGGAKIYNGTLAVKVRTLLYGSGLPAKFWSSALLHSVYLHNQLVHSATGKTPYKGWYGHKPDILHLKTFGSRVCVKQTALVDVSKKEMTSLASSSGTWQRI